MAIAMTEEKNWVTAIELEHEASNVTGATLTTNHRETKCLVPQSAQSASDDDGELHYQADSKPKHKLISNLLAQPCVEVKLIDEAGSDGGEDCAYDHEGLEFTDLANSD